MAYTNPGWPTGIPPGSDPANTADDQLRRLRLDLLERMNDLTVDFTADPVVPKGSKYRIHYTGGLLITGTAQFPAAGFEFVAPSALSAAITWIISLILPVGVTLSQVQSLVYRDAGASIVMSIIKIESSGVATIISSTTDTGTGWHSLDKTGLVEVVAAGASYWAKFVLTNDALSTVSARLASAAPVF